MAVYNNGKDTAPDSCCLNEAIDCGKGALHEPYSSLHKKGCLAEFKMFVESKTLLVGGFVLGAIAIQLIAVITGCCLAKKIVEKYNHV